MAVRLVCFSQDVGAMRPKTVSRREKEQKRRRKGHTHKLRTLTYYLKHVTFTEHCLGQLGAVGGAGLIAGDAKVTRSIREGFILKQGHL